MRPGDPAGRDAVVGAGPDHHLFEVAHVAVDVASVGAEVEDGVAHDLPGAVVGDVAAAAGLEHVEAAGAQGLRGEEQVLGPGVASQGEDRLVLEEQQGVGYVAGLSLGHQARLQLEAFGVGDPAESPHHEDSPLAGAHGRTRVLRRVHSPAH